MGLKFRRGTTAQKSGSLAFGEPYVNTELNTLQIGGASGDITLGTSTGGNYAGFGANTFTGDQSITGSLGVTGNITLGGNLQIGDQTTDTVQVVASLSSSLIPSVTNTFDLGSATKIWKDLYISTGSIKIVNPGTGVVVGTLSSNASGDFNTAGAISSSTITGIGNVTLYSASVAQTFVTQSGLISSLSGSVKAVTDTFATSASVASATATSISTLSGSVKAVTDTFATSASVASATATSISTLSGSVKAVTDTFATSASVASATAASITTLSASIASTDSTQSTNISINSNAAWGAFQSASAYSSSAATTYAVLNRNNTFTGTQTITGSLYVSANLVVQGSSSLQNITASAVSIGTNTVLLNTADPSVRYAGLTVIDSGSAAGKSGSFVFDSKDDEWIFVHQGNAAVTSSTMITGPETFDNLGNETHLTDNKLVKAKNGFHIVDSNISDDGTKVTVTGGLDVTGALSASTITGFGNVTSHSSSVATRLNTIETAGYAVSSSVASATATSITSLSSSVKAVTDTFATSASLASARATDISTISGSVKAVTDAVSSRVTTIEGKTLVSGSAQIDGSLLGSNKTITIGSTSTTLGGTSTTIAGLTSVTSTGFTGSLTGNATTATTLQTTRAINGVNFDGSAAITITANTTNALTIGTGLSGTSFNGSGAVTIANTGVTSNVAGTGISVSGATGAVTITNTGVTSAVAGTGVSVSGATGAVTFSIGQAVATTSAVTFASVTATGDIVAYSTSDKRHKNNIQLIPNALEKVSKLNGVTWEWNDDVEDVTKLSPKTGLIAQEVQEVLPEVVTERENGFLGLDYSKMVGLLVEAIKEQQTQIAELKAEVEALKK
jgi:hypothetical protein